MTLHLQPLTLDAAREYLAAHARHYATDAEPLLAIGVREVADICGAVIIGKVDAKTAALAHIYCDGKPQGYTLLYGAAWRAAKAMGFERMVL